MTRSLSITLPTEQQTAGFARELPRFRPQEKRDKGSCEGDFEVVFLGLGSLSRHGLKMQRFDLSVLSLGGPKIQHYSGQRHLLALQGLIECICGCYLKPPNCLRLLTIVSHDAETMVLDGGHWQALSNMVCAVVSVNDFLPREGNGSTQRTSWA